MKQSQVFVEVDKLKETINVIIFFLKLKKSTNKNLEVYAINEGSIDYLLGQFLRQICLPKENYYISEKARDLWLMIRNELNEIWDTFYKKIVVNEVSSHITVKTYSGASKKYNEKSFIIGSKFYYREVFHDDHITTIKSIKDELYELEEINEDNIKAIIKKIKVCKILKEEDRIKNRLNNDSDLFKLYRDNNIKLINYKDI